MTYCFGIKINEGIIMASDSRTTAGIDNVNTYSKMWRYGSPGNRQIIICSAGNLATTQAVIARIEQDIQTAAAINLLTVNSLYDAAAYVGGLNVEAQKQNTGGGMIFESSFLIGGNIVGAKSEIYMIYPEGNFIATSTQSPYLQIGETKYGKPILDRAIKHDTPLDRAILCGLVSMDAAMKSNLSVGPPIEISILENDSTDMTHYHSFEDGDNYLQQLRATWTQFMSDALDRLEHFDWRNS